MATQSASLAFNADYLRSREGVLRIAEAIIGLCGAISVSQGAYCNYGGTYSFFNFVAITTLILAVIIMVIFIISLDKLCTVINFPLSMLINDAIFTILYFIATILMFITIGCVQAGMAARIVTSIFGVLGTIVVGLLAFSGYQVFRGRSSQPAGDRTDPA